MTHIPRFIQFGKYRGMSIPEVDKLDRPYLLWVMDTEIVRNNPLIHRDILIQLQNPINETVTLVPHEFHPVGISINKGIETGQQIQRLDPSTLQAYNIKPFTSTVSKTGRSGYRTWLPPIHPGVYLLTTIDGDGHKDAQYLVKEGDAWFEIKENSKNAVLKYLEDKQ